MTNERLDKITSKVVDIYRQEGVFVGDIDTQNDLIADLLDVIASLHNELYKEVTGEYYDYMHHHANLGYGGCPNDCLFKEAENE